jgi:intracellular septation protein A
MSEEQQPYAIDVGAMLGGRRGVIDASLPGITLVIVDTFAPLGWAIAASVLTAVAIAILRKVRGEPLRQAVMGLPFLAFCAVLAAFTGHAKTYFLPGILTTAAGAVIVTASILVRRPVIGYVAATLDAAYHQWRSHPGQRRAATYATIIWAVVLSTRAGVQGYLYTHGHDDMIAAVRLFMSTPLTIVAVAASFYLLEAEREDEEREEGALHPSGSGGEPATS